MNKYFYSLILCFSIGSCLACEAPSQEMTPQQFAITAQQINLELTRGGCTPSQLQKIMGAHEAEIQQFFNYIKTNGLSAVYRQMHADTTTSFNALLTAIERCMGIFDTKPATDDKEEIYFEWDNTNTSTIQPLPQMQLHSTPSPVSQSPQSPINIMPIFSSQMLQILDTKKQIATPVESSSTLLDPSDYNDFAQDFESRHSGLSPRADYKFHELPSFIENCNSRFGRAFKDKGWKIKNFYHAIAVLCQRQYIPCDHIFLCRTDRHGGGHFLNAASYSRFKSSVTSEIIQNTDTKVMYTCVDTSSRTTTPSSATPPPPGRSSSTTPVDHTQNATLICLEENGLDEISLIRILRRIELGLEGSELACKDERKRRFVFATINGRIIPLEIIYGSNMIMDSVFPIFSYTDLTVTSQLSMNIQKIHPMPCLPINISCQREKIIDTIKSNLALLKERNAQFYRTMHDGNECLIIDIAPLLTTAVQRGIYVKIHASDIHPTPKSTDTSPTSSPPYTP